MTDFAKQLLRKERETMTECLVKSEVVERLKHIIATRRGAEAFMAQKLLEWIENEAHVVVIEENRNEEEKG